MRTCTLNEGTATKPREDLAAKRTFKQVKWHASGSAIGIESNEG